MLQYLVLNLKLIQPFARTVLVFPRTHGMSVDLRLVMVNCFPFGSLEMSPISSFSIEPRAKIAVLIFVYFFLLFRENSVAIIHQKSY